MNAQALDAFLARSGLAAPDVARRWTPLEGGVSSDIWRVDLADGRTLCVKRALPRLKVAAEWTAPVSRNAKIEVESRYAPAPLTPAWEGRPGTIAWQQTLAPGAEARFTAEHTVRHDKDVMLDENTP